MKKLYDLEKKGVETCAKALAEELAAGSLVVLPTDTVYGLAAAVDHAPAVRRIFELKGRSWEKSLVIMLSSLEEAESFLAEEVSACLRRLSPFWPGPLTVVARRRGYFPWMGEAAPGRDTLGLRIPDHPLVLALLQRTGPLAVTSANLSGQKPPRRFEEIPQAILEAVGAACRSCKPGSGMPSTVIELRGEKVELLRPGPLELRQIREVLNDGPKGEI